MLVGMAKQHKKNLEEPFEWVFRLLSLSIDNFF